MIQRGGFSFWHRYKQQWFQSFNVAIQTRRGKERPIGRITNGLFINGFRKLNTYLQN